MTKLEVSEFIKLIPEHTLFDVRTPSEFAEGHIPGARNLPLFSDDERAIIGTLYKKSGKEVAVMKGLELVGPKMKSIVADAKKMASGKTVLVHCWRGGMRSESVAWLLGFCGFDVVLLAGGYKAYRNWALQKFDEDRNVVILSGATGSGKTLVLGEISLLGSQVVDLEGIAHHKGSAYGALGEISQPTQTQFENDLAMALNGTRPDETLWLEDESRTIGRCVIPGGLWTLMRKAKVVVADIPLSVRLDYLMEGYGSFSKEELLESTRKIEERLGNVRTKNALQAIERGDIRSAIENVLDYYDRAYNHGLMKRDNSTIFRKKFELESFDAKKIAEGVLSFSKEVV